MFRKVCLYAFLFLFYSATKSALFLSLLLTYNHAYSLIDPAPLVLLSGCIFVGFRLWSIRVRTIDPFLTSQTLLWNVLTRFSMTSQRRETRTETRRETRRETGSVAGPGKKSLTVSREGGTAGTGEGDDGDMRGSGSQHSTPSSSTEGCEEKDKHLKDD